MGLAAESGCRQQRLPPVDSLRAAFLLLYSVQKQQTSRHFTDHFWVGKFFLFKYRSLPFHTSFDSSLIIVLLPKQGAPNCIGDFSAAEFHVIFASLSFSILRGNVPWYVSYAWSLPLSIIGADLSKGLA